MNAESKKPTALTDLPLGMKPAFGLYDPRHEHDACGIGLYANIHNKKSHEIVTRGLDILHNLEHRGAVGADPKAGDGAGILIQIPHEFFAAEAEKNKFKLPAPGKYGVGFLFMPKKPAVRAEMERIWRETASDEGLKVLGWRDVPVDQSVLGYSVKDTEPFHRQIFIGMGPTIRSEEQFERKLYVCRKVASNRIRDTLGDEQRGYYPVSVSCRTVVYKGLILGVDVANYYVDLKNPAVQSAFALVHQRFSTNTFPSWPLAHPYRFICHNGEINTVRGNFNWMAARQANMKSDVLGEDLEKLWPISYEGQSDTAIFDNALELLTMGGYSLPHAMMMMIPEAWAGNPLMDDDRRAFYEHHAAMMEPWDGPAAMVFTDGKVIGATLDRNGLRPSRFLTTDDGHVMLASEMGCLQFDETKITTKWRLQPGKMLLIDLEKKKIVSDEDLKKELAAAHPYKEWLKKTQVVLKDLPKAKTARPKITVPLLDRQQAFGYTKEDLAVLMAPMAETGQEAVGSMGNDAPISALSDRSKMLDTYFKQNFAQVTNPPIDPIREELVMSLVSFIGPRPNLLDLKGTSNHMRLEVSQPILSNEELERIRHIGSVRENPFKTATIDITYDVANGPEYMAAALDSVCALAERAVADGYNIIILSDRSVSAERAPIPALLAVSATHHHLIRKGLRTQVGLVVESGEPREVHQFATLAGYGAEAINPYLAFETLEAMLPTLEVKVSAKDAEKYYIKAVGKGLLKVMSKMGISTYQSYCGAQIFDAVGLSSEFVKKYFTGTATQIEGVGLAQIAAESFQRHEDAFGLNPVLATTLDIGGDYAQRSRGEAHVWTAETVSTLQHAVRGNSQDKYKEFARLINEQNEKLKTIRGLFRVKTADEMGKKPVALEEVEPAKDIVRRFATGAMSFGSISREAHTTLAIAMNRIGGRSNTGEGGEEADRFVRMANGDSMRSSIKQVASGRFGVTTEYLVNSDMMQIKMAQGAKPGEGGQLPGHKVDAVIAKVRHSTQGVGLISPPPHHDIYSIEDLAQLIFDLKNVNPSGLVSVKLVSEVGVGTVAAGVSKAHADHVTISGYEGGTGASPLTSIKHAGSPWEIGLAETQQTLVANDLRGRITVQADGGIRSGRDVMIAALLGADEIGFATAPLIAAGCIMMRKCHLNTCPVGVATQDPELRKRFKGAPEHVINYFFFVAEELRGLMAAMGVTKFDELIGKTEWLDTKKAIAHWKARGLDFTRLFAKADVTGPIATRKVQAQDHGIDKILDRELIAKAQPALETGKAVVIETKIRNRDRSAGAMLSGEVAKKYGHAGLKEDTIHVKLSGTSGQSFGAWAARGVTLELTGEGNDYAGKGLSGGKLIIKPNEKIGFVPEKSIIVGNTVLYGAITGEAYFRGVAGERFAVRNSGAVAVVEGTGDHGCEYMTGGCVLVIGPTGRNFAAGMSGGVAYVFDEDKSFKDRCNLSMVELKFVADDPTSGMVDITSKMDRNDAARIHELLVRHLKYTGSTRAKAILDSWKASLPKFIKVMPTEYARALADLEKAEAAAMKTAAE